MILIARLAAFLRFLLAPRFRRVAGKIERLKRMLYMVEATTEVEIACEEAYRLLDQYADALQRGEDAAALMPQVKRHLELCMDCGEELETLLAALRATGG